MVKKILFICTGNTCRSVMAEFVLKKILKERNISDIEVSSAGIAASPAYMISGDLKNVLDEEKMDVSSHVSTQATPGIINDADLILVMEQRHRDVLERILPGAGKKTRLLKEYAGEDDDFDIADPIGQPERVYRATMNEIRGYITKLLPGLMKKRSE